MHSAVLAKILAHIRTDHPVHCLALIITKLLYIRTSIHPLIPQQVSKDCYIMHTHSSYRCACLY